MAFTSNDDLNILQASDSQNVGAGAGNDVYIITPNSMSAGQTINITDTEGANTIKLVGGVTIESSVVAADAIQLTLNNGSIVNIFGADTFGYVLGGDAFDVNSGLSQSFTEFVTDSLGTTVPTGSDTANGTKTGEVSDEGTVGTPPAPTFSLAPVAANVDEGATANFTLTTTNVADGTTVAYTISGVDTDDVTGRDLTGTATVTNNTATIAVELAADAKTEGEETLTVAIDGQTGVSASTKVNDTSTTPTTPTFALAADQTGVDEGGTATFTLTTTNVAAGTEVAYTLTGVEAADVTGGSLTGKATVDALGKATITVSLAEDAATEGEETLTVAIDGQTGVSATTTVNDTSLTPSTFTLTTASDDSVTGSAGDDTITGVVSGLGSTNTLQVTDKIDGGTGTDTLDIELTTDFGGFTSGTGSMTNVEVLDIANTASLSRTFDTSGITGLTTIKLDANDQGFSVTDLEATGQTIELSNADETKDLSLAYVTTAISGSSDAVTVKLNDVGTAKTTSTPTEKVLSLKNTGIEKLTVDSAGTTNIADLSGFADAKSITVTGSAALKVTTIDPATNPSVGSKVTEIDASAATGKLTIDATGASASFDTAKMGSGNDTLTVKSIATAATLEGGAGTDTLAFKGTGGSSNTITVQPTLTGFETLSFTGLGGDLTIAGSNIKDVTTVNIVNALNKEVKLAQLPNTDLTISLSGKVNNTDNGTDATSSNDKDAGNVVYTGTGALTIETSTTSSSAASKATEISAASVSTATINVGSNADLQGTVTLGSATSVAIDSKEVLSSLKLAADKVTSLTLKSTKDVTTHTDTSLKALQSASIEVTGKVDLTATANNVDAAVGESSKSVSIDANKVTGTVDVNVASYSAGSGQAQVTGSTLSANIIKIGTGRNEVAVTGSINDDTVTLFNDGTVATASAVTVSGEGSYNINLGTVSSGDTLKLGGNASDNFDLSVASVTLTGVDTIEGTGTATLTMKAADLSGQKIAVNNLAVTLEGTSSADTIDLSNLSGSGSATFAVNGNAGNDTIKAGSGTDTIVFANTATNNGVDTITGFTGGTDILNLDAFGGGTTTAVTGALTTTANVIYTLDASATADAADSAKAVATAINAAATFTDADATAWIVIGDDNSTAIYSWTDTAASANEVADSELTLVGTVDAAGSSGILANANIVNNA